MGFTYQSPHGQAGTQGQPGEAARKETVGPTPSHREEALCPRGGQLPLSGPSGWEKAW